MVIEVINISHLVTCKAKDDAPIPRYLHGIEAVILTFQGVSPKAREVNFIGTRCLIQHAKDASQLIGMIRIDFRGAIVAMSFLSPLWRICWITGSDLH